VNSGSSRRLDRLPELVERLLALPAETEWLEFKENKFKPEEIGEYISALANSAALVGQVRGYLIWGVRDSDHEVVGTSVDPHQKVGNEDLVNWLLTLTRPQVHFQFHVLEVRGLRVVVLEISAAMHSPVRFRGEEWIRVGSYKKKLNEHVDHARRLWKTLDESPFETAVAAQSLDAAEVIQLIDYPAYFDLYKMPLPDNRDGILEVLVSESIVRESLGGGWDVTNLGAILFAKDISAFPSLARKALRIVQYRGNGRTETIREQVGVRGYAGGFAGAIEFLSNLLPSNEVIGQAIRANVLMYPELAIRELIANALIHQDFAQTGNGPMVELFDRRIEITNPGRPLVDPERFVDAPPKSRNEDIAHMMRRAGICEERGSGWDKIVAETEVHQLPAPLVEQTQESTRVTLFAPKSLKDMDKEERIRAVYWHASLRYVMREQCTNSSVRERFGIASQNSATASRLIGEAVAAKMISAVDLNASKKYMRYVPFWAEGRAGSL
jgi:ATP-dependent DNA helicase RecG